MWEVIFPNISIQGGFVDPNVHGFFDGPSHAVLLPAFNLEVLHWCVMATTILMSKNWRWCLQMLLISFTKCPFWLSYILLITVNPPTAVTVNDTVLIGDTIFIFWWHQEVLKCLPSVEIYSYTMFSTYVC